MEWLPGFGKAAEKLLFIFLGTIAVVFFKLGTGELQEEIREAWGGKKKRDPPDDEEEEAEEEEDEEESDYG